MSTLQVEPPPVRDPDTWGRGWTCARRGLLVAVLAMLAVAVLTGDRRGSYADLHDALRAGEVDRVVVTDGLAPGGQGYALQEVLWRDGLVQRRAEVWQVQGDERPEADGLPVAEREAGLDLLAAYPGLVVDRAPASVASTTEILGWRQTGCAAGSGLALVLAAFMVLLLGPTPWRATRWGWFWLFWTPPGLLAFLLLGGPGALPAPRPGAWRMHGGWAFLLALVVGGTIGGS
ncbi:hypothetical protein [Vallicoccus soli]|uniref:Uncharacterized protein n=1 Tax=Vallicoccus soli TaxID=2339232 RepID=A0A3A3Z1H6_9ACTN|nr:hypothetical protein [Vallicoccus soli]RJK95338.1 hypothetical protein D5H78_11775 [Vallicoccus soli]